MNQPQLPPKGAAFGLSFSGGKDGLLALWRAKAAGAVPQVLVNMLIETGGRSRSHGLRSEVIAAQAASMGIELVHGAASWGDYEARFIEVLSGLKARGIEHMVFGDIDLEDHRLWEERVCAAAGVTAHLPLYLNARVAMLEEFIAAGFKAMIVAVKDGVMDPAFLGRLLDQDLKEELARLGIDPCGEEGEYHSLVVDGPLFTHEVKVVPGERVLRDGVWFLDLDLA
ncbi:MAG: diphthine--ammonia ligase [bacterium]|nr:diphthine--ammonia ligase [bacterium]